MKTPYDVLGVAPGADEKTIANAFRAAAKACHPDLNPEDRAAERQFKQITAARDALKSPEWRALYRYLQFRRQHDRRHWMITMVSCTLSALVSAGLVSLLQKQSISEPLSDERLPLLAANLDPEVGGGRHQFELAGIAREARRQEGGAAQIAIQEMHAGPGREPETRDKPLDLAAFRQAPARPGLTVEAALREIIREQDNARTAPKQQAGKSCDRPDHRAAQSPQPAGERCAGSPRQPQPHRAARTQRTRAPAAASRRGPSRTLWSLLGLTAGPPPSARPARHASIQAPRAAQQSRPSNASSNECGPDAGGVRSTPCGTSGGSK
jgi:curved DNA-binding protein CbpA